MMLTELDCITMFDKKITLINFLLEHTMQLLL